MNFKELLDFLISQNEADRQNFGVGFMTPPAETHEISQCIESTTKFFKFHLDENYAEILKYTDGFSCNGFNLYGSKQKDEPYYLDGIIAINLEFWEEESLRKYFAYSEESTTRIVFNIESKMYEIVDRVSWEKLYEFDNFIEALSFNLEECCIF
ncbi:YrhA family protein [Vibrio cholerae]|nr:hypothetical protein [Vibrio cholerae]